MPNRSGYVFVLWGNKFEEVTATIFVTELRKAGFLVKVVGLNPPQIKGACGLALVPDLMLDEALLLAAKANCVIVPGLARNLKWFKNDPRLTEFLNRAHANGAKIVVGQSNEIDIWGLCPVTENIIYYAGMKNLAELIRELANLL